MPRKNLAGKALGIRTQVTMQWTEDLLVVFTKPKYKDHGSKSREQPDRVMLARSKEKLDFGGRDSGRKD